MTQNISLDKKEIEKALISYFKIKKAKVKWNLEIKYSGDQRDGVEYSVLKGCEIVKENR